MNTIELPKNEKEKSPLNLANAPALILLFMNLSIPNTNYKRCKNKLHFITKLLLLPYSSEMSHNCKNTLGDYKEDCSTFL